MALLPPSTLPAQDYWLLLAMPDAPELRRAVVGTIEHVCRESAWEDTGIGAEAAAHLCQGVERVRLVGAIIPFTGNLPANFLPCEGQLLPVSEYGALHNVIGYTYGGAGSSFALPDLRGNVLRGGVPGVGGGQDTITLQESQLPAHTHTTHAHAQVAANGGVEAPVIVLTEIPGSTGSTGGGSPIDIVPTNQEVIFAICTR